MLSKLDLRDIEKDIEKNIYCKIANKVWDNIKHTACVNVVLDSIRRLINVE